MSHHMRTALHAKPEVNFFEQMIPHHINAVNMVRVHTGVRGPVDPAREP